jgi:hypothetical protein
MLVAGSDLRYDLNALQKERLAEETVASVASGCEGSLVAYRRLGSGRVNIYGYMLWMLVLAIALLRVRDTAASE